MSYLFSLDGIMSVPIQASATYVFIFVLFGAFGQIQASAAVTEQRIVKSATPEEAAQILEAAHNVVIVPGYGMAVAQAQHRVHDLYEQLANRGIDVKFAIHPVAGRMPGHMNVLLAEAEGIFAEAAGRVVIAGSAAVGKAGATGAHEGCSQSIPRHHLQYVITEHGVADLNGLTHAGRAQALIEIAHPGFPRV
jgi:hypothetical protein